jgi:hypothetical protein
MNKQRRLFSITAVTLLFLLILCNPSAYAGVSETELNLPAGSHIVGTDAAGYITLAKYVDVNSTCAESGVVKTVTVAKMALLDREYNMILDFIADGVSPAQIHFRDGLAVIATGANEWRSHTQHGRNSISSNAKYGVIDRNGNFSIQPIYHRMQNLGYGKFHAADNDGSYVLNHHGISLPNPPYRVGLFPSMASEWAGAEVFEAYNLGLFGREWGHFYNTWQWDISRQQFCELVMVLYEKAMSKSIIKHEDAGESPFADTGSPAVIAAYEISVVTGRGNHIFDPFSHITRQEAAVMLSRLANAIGEPLRNQTAAFADSHTISSWAVESAGQVQAAGIMRGTGGNRFSPKGSYTVEQSIITMLRLYKAAAVVK